MTVQTEIVPDIAAAARELGDVLIDCVEGGASVSFMWPMRREKADRFWAGVDRAAREGHAVVLAARDEYGICGTVQLRTDLPENQPHRGDIAKLLVHRRARGRGIGEALMRHIEEIASGRGLSLLVLDTASPQAERIYRRLGWQECGTIPEYALNPDGSPCDTTVFYRRLARE